MQESIKGLRLQRMKQVHTIKPRDLYARYGKRLSLNSNFEATDEPVVDTFTDKLSALEFISAYDKQMAREEASRKAGTIAESDGKDDANDEEA